MNFQIFYIFSINFVFFGKCEFAQKMHLTFNKTHVQEFNISNYFPDEEKPKFNTCFLFKSNVPVDVSFSPCRNDSFLTVPFFNDTQYKNVLPNHFISGLRAVLKTDVECSRNSGKFYIHFKANHLSSKGCFKIFPCMIVEEIHSQTKYTHRQIVEITNPLKIPKKIVRTIIYSRNNGTLTFSVNVHELIVKATILKNFYMDLQIDVNIPVSIYISKCYKDRPLLLWSNVLLSTITFKKETLDVFLKYGLLESCELNDNSTNEEVLLTFDSVIRTKIIGSFTFKLHSSDEVNTHYDMTDFLKSGAFSILPWKIWTRKIDVTDIFELDYDLHSSLNFHITTGAAVSIWFSGCMYSPRFHMFHQIETGNYQLNKHQLALMYDAMINTECEEKYNSDNLQLYLHIKTFNYESIGYFAFFKLEQEKISTVLDFPSNNNFIVALNSLKYDFTATFHKNGTSVAMFLDQIGTKYSQEKIITGPFEKINLENMKFECNPNNGDQCSYGHDKYWLALKTPESASPFSVKIELDSKATNSSILQAENLVLNSEKKQIVSRYKIPENWELIDFHFRVRIGKIAATIRLCLNDTHSSVENKLRTGYHIIQVNVTNAQQITSCNKGDVDKSQLFLIINSERSLLDIGYFEGSSSSTLSIFNIELILAIFLICSLIVL